MEPTTSDTKYCERFDAADSDVTIVSSDGVLFKVHKKSLATYSEVFPDGDLATNDETVPLSERSSTLELLFQYMYRQPQPDITELPFDQLSSLAEAAEKYRVFSAMEICRVIMKASLPKNAIAVLAYAVRHGYTKVYVEAAPHTIMVDPKEAFEHLGHVWFVHWVLYREPYLKVLIDARKAPSAGGHLLHRGGFEECELWKPFQGRVVDDIGGDLSALNRINDIFAAASDSKLSTCTQCRRRAESWSAQIIKRVSSLPQFSLTL
ncbi:hypothetical protein DAEQUDRAFT_726754 [Daedalea quercina L-15889]|uniref:BTB domain-containing protein n=1 Tax=Daedalea quercina L-15889 TaxID=1314783 RepID=A0A165QGK6_9APHY|nr:hypothetical protein DAEQUDRAFT_726754 [Daedalea quercina L-15889]